MKYNHISKTKELIDLLWLKSNEAPILSLFHSFLSKLDLSTMLL